MFLGNGLVALAALIAIFFIAFGRRRGARNAILIVLAVFIVCGCGAFNNFN